MKRKAGILLALLLMLCLARGGAETATQPDRQILFEESRIIAGVKTQIMIRPEIRRLTETAPAGTKLNWQSSNPEVAAVNAWGRVTTLTPGETLITAQAADDPGISGTFELSVVWPVEELVAVEPEITLTLGPGGTKDETDLFYFIRPSDAWMGGTRWTTSNAAVVTVDESGHVRAVAPGSATVTAEAVMPAGCGQTRRATFRISVNREAEKLTLSEQSVALKKGGIFLLSAGIEPADATGVKLVWTSSDPAVAEVTNGRIKAAGSGRCEIRCTSADGKLSASCEVTVTWPVKYVTLSERSMTLSPGDQLQLTAAAHPADADEQGMIWASSNAQIAVVDDTGLVTAALGGDCVISCTPKDGNGRGAQCSIHVLPFSVAQEEWVVDQPAGITIPIRWHSFEPVALELKTGSDHFRAVWDSDSNISIQPLATGTGTLIIRSADAWSDHIELKIRIADGAVTNPDNYPRMTFDALLKEEPEIGTKGKILGKVLQRIEQPEQVILLVGTAGEDWGRENFWVEYAPGDPVTEAAEGNLVIVFGNYQGVYTYESAGGTEISVPALKARQIIVR